MKFNFFKKDKSEKVEASVELDNESVVDVDSEAEKLAKITYNKSVIESIRKELSIQYGVRYEYHGTLIAQAGVTTNENL